jgi:hypothetical protein
VPDADSFLKHAWNLVVVRRHYYCSSRRKGNERFDFTYYINQLRWRSCKDDRDCIYALKSLLPEHSDLAITPDYNKTVVQVFTDLALQQLQHGHIEILYQAGLCRDMASVFHDLLPPYAFPISEPVPTWVPDYRRNTTYIGWKPYFGDELSFLPDTTITPTCAVSSDNPRMLTTQCTLLDVVDGVLPLPFVHNDKLRADHPKIFFRMRQFLNELYKGYIAAYPSPLYPNGEAPSTAFAKALLGGGTSEEYKNHSDLEREMKWCLPCKYGKNTKKNAYLKKGSYAKKCCARLYPPAQLDVSMGSARNGTRTRKTVAWLVNSPII